MTKTVDERIQEENKVKNCCPICGHEFDDVGDINVCPTTHYGENVFKPEDLIGPWDDYAWCL